MLYLVSYDLRAKPEGEYVSLGQYLAGAGGVRILYSEWLLPSWDTAENVFNAVAKHVYADDSLWVMQITRNGWRRGGLASDAAVASAYQSV